MQPPSDAELLAAYVHGQSETAFAALVARHLGLVHSAAFRQLGDVHQAEEITQSVFILLAHKAAQLDPKIVLAGWLCRTAHLAARDALKTDRRRRRREHVAAMNLPDPNDTLPIWHQLAPVLDEAVAQLREADRAALVLRYYEQKPLAEVGAALGVGADAAQKRVTRALKKLRHRFARRGITLSAALIGSAIAAHAVQAAPAGLAQTISAAALAHGAAASPASLTLLKTLKLMAWTKTKTATITTAIVLLAGIGSVPIIHYFHAAPPTQHGNARLPTGNVTPMIKYAYGGGLIVLASDGSLWSWGEESLGWPVLGLGNTHNTVSLQRIGKENDWISVAASDSACLAIKSDGTLWGWGGNTSYELGDGTKTTRSSPVLSIPGHDWKQATIGASSLAIKTNGTLWAWGNNWAGQLGIGNTKSMTNAVQVGTATNWIKIWNGLVQTVGLQADGSLWFCGSLSGEATKPTITSLTRVSPDTNWVDVGFGYSTVFAIKSDGTLWTWGREAFIYTGTSSAPNSDPKLQPEQIGTDQDWQSISSNPGGFYHLLRKKDGSLWALDASEHRIVKEASQYKPIALKKIEWHKDIAAFAAGGDNIGVILTPNGEVWTWGRVLGEHTPKDFWTNHRWGYPTHNNIETPWQVFNLPN